ncbi:pentapeptide repeat-containing protein, partial [Nostoc sp.]|uniref:pentapeptide repeat-containing protein n=1 Tax=Nostoc sp. TaxID=1180 RepID=UPI002FF15A51
SISCCAPSCHLCLFLNPTYIYVSRLFCTTKGANLEGAYLSGANLKNAKVSDDELSNAFLEGAIMPNGSRYKSSLSDR